MMTSSFHRNWMYRIDRNKKDVGSAIVLDDGYLNYDYCHTIIYTGTGRRDKKTNEIVNSK